MLCDHNDVEDVLFRENKLIEYIKEGTILIDHTTSSPELAKRIYKACEEKDCFSLDAPI